MKVQTKTTPGRLPRSAQPPERARRTDEVAKKGAPARGCALERLSTGPLIGISARAATPPATAATLSLIAKARRTAASTCSRQQRPCTAPGSHLALFPPLLPTCSPSLAKLADRMEGLTIMSSLEKESTDTRALTRTEVRPARRATCAEAQHGGQVRCAGMGAAGRCEAGRDSAQPGLPRCRVNEAHTVNAKFLMVQAR